MEEFKKEKLLKNYPSFVTIENTSKILNQMKSNIFKIETKNGKGTGFFCFIPSQNEKYLY